MTEIPFDVHRAHRWFAVELNNLAWELVETDQLTDGEIELMVHAAHASCLHWLEVGDVLNHLRAQCLLASAYVKAKLPEAAVRHAQRCLLISKEAGDTQTAFERATAHGCASAAYKLAGRIEDARAQHRLARLSADKFEDPAEGPLFERLYPVP